MNPEIPGSKMFPGSFLYLTKNHIEVTQQYKTALEEIRNNEQTVGALEGMKLSDPSPETSIQQKINKLNLPRNFSYRPVLIHVNGVQSAVTECEYFAKIINFGQFLS